MREQYNTGELHCCTAQAQDYGLGEGVRAEVRMLLDAEDSSHYGSDCN